MSPSTPVAKAPRLLVESSRALPLVSLSIGFTEGSALDPQGKAGLTRLLGRLMRRTGGGHSADTLDTRIDSLGGSLGVEATYSTLSFQGTCISQSLNAFVDTIQEIVSQPSFDVGEFDKLKAESRAELLSSLDNDASIARHWFRRKMFAGHPYGSPASGTIPSLAAIEHADVATQYREVFAQSELVFAFAGDVDGETAEAIARRFDPQPFPKKASHALEEPPFPIGRHLVVVDKPERTQTQILIGTRGSSPHDPDHTALHVANTVFGGTFTSRLMNEVRSQRGWSYGASSHLPYERRRQSLSMHTFPKATDAAACVELQIQLLEAFCERGITQEELESAKKYLVRSHAFAVDTASKRVAQKLDELIYQLPADYHSEYLDRVKSVSLDEANQAVSRRISPADLLIVVVCTEAPLREELQKAVSNLASYQVIPFDAEAQTQ